VASPEIRVVLAQKRRNRRYRRVMMSHSFLQDGGQREELHLQVASATGWSTELVRLLTG
jgi:hypothetical protein